MSTVSGAASAPDCVSASGAAAAIVDPPSLPDVEAAEPPRRRNAVTSPPVGTIATTSQPSADFSFSLVANAAGSYDEELTVTYSDMSGESS